MTRAANCTDPTHYRMRLVSDLSGIDARRWDALAYPDANGNPFLRHAFLDALHRSGSACAQSGWSPSFITLWDREDLVAAMPLYEKHHSYGEYVFDWAWADAYARHGFEYYPKLLSAVPFTPVTGMRLIATDDGARRRLVSEALALARKHHLSSLHVLYPTEEEAGVLAGAGLMERTGVQFHWSNPGYTSFDDFLEQLERKKRKNIRAERRQVREAGVTCTVLEGREIGEEDWRFFVRCYRETYRLHHSSPYLNLAFFDEIGRTMPENLVLIVAHREGRPIASSLIVRNATTLYGRYWGALEHVPLLHFECAYYQPINLAIESKIALFEGGAQGEHKMARGFLPVRTRSAHWLAHPSFASAVDEFLMRESRGIDLYMNELNERNPFKNDHRETP